MAKTTIEVNTITLPARWASSLINGDYSGLDELEAMRCQAIQKDFAGRGMRVVSTVDDSAPRFTWCYQLYDPGADCGGGDVMDYVVHIHVL